MAHYEIYAHYGINEFIICCYKGNFLKELNKFKENWKIQCVDTGLKQ